MAGIQVDIDVHDARVSELFIYLEQRLGHLTPVFRAIGQDVVAAVEENFEKEQSPEGSKWEKSKRAERQGGQTLRDRGILCNSIHAEAGPWQVVVGTPVIYAATHQFGAEAGAFGSFDRNRVGAWGWYKTQIPWGDIPARPFLGINDSAMEKIRETLLSFLLR